MTNRLVLMFGKPMPSDVKHKLLADLRRRFGSIKKLANSQSLFEIGSRARIYVRYSKLHPGRRTFYCLRQMDLKQLEGRQALICFLWDSQKEPLLIPYRDFEEVFVTLSPASDGQFKAQVYPQLEGTELYIANAGRFNVESYFGWNETNSISLGSPEHWNRELTHSQKLFSGRLVQRRATIFGCPEVTEAKWTGILQNGSTWLLDCLPREIWKLLRLKST